MPMNSAIVHSMISVRQLRRVLISHLQVLRASAFGPPTTQAMALGFYPYLTIWRSQRKNCLSEGIETYIRRRIEAGQRELG